MNCEITCVVILGMHRSGTSSLAGSLQKKGLYLGKVFESNPYNRKGNRENEQIMLLNEDVLATSGGSWDNPPAGLAWSPSQTKERDRIIGLFESTKIRPWGFKDPRTLLTLDFWAAGINNLNLVGTFRHPVLVVQSLVSRNGMPEDKALGLWYAYNRKLLSQLEQEEFPLVSFDLPPTEYRQSIDRVAADIGISDKSTADDGRSFFEESLRHHILPTGEELLPEEVRLVYSRLNSICKGQQ